MERGNKRACEIRGGGGARWRKISDGGERSEREPGRGVKQTSKKLARRRRSEEGVRRSNRDKRGNDLTKSSARAELHQRIYVIFFLTLLSWKSSESLRIPPSIRYLCKNTQY